MAGCMAYSGFEDAATGLSPAGGLPADRSSRGWGPAAVVGPASCGVSDTPCKPLPGCCCCDASTGSRQRSRPGPWLLSASSPSLSLSFPLSLPLSSLLLSLWWDPAPLLRLLLELSPLLPLPSASAASSSDASSLDASDSAEKQPAGAGARALGSASSSNSMPLLLMLPRPLLCRLATNPDNRLGVRLACLLRLLLLLLLLDMLLLELGGLLLLGAAASSSKEKRTENCALRLLPLLLRLDKCTPCGLSAASTAPPAPRSWWLLLAWLWLPALSTPPAVLPSTAAPSAAAYAQAPCSGAAAPAWVQLLLCWQSPEGLPSLLLLQASQLPALDPSSSCDCSICEGSAARMGPIWLAAAVLTAAMGSQQRLMAVGHRLFSMASGPATAAKRPSCSAKSLRTRHDLVPSPELDASCGSVCRGHTNTVHDGAAQQERHMLQQGGSTTLQAEVCSTATPATVSRCRLAHILADSTCAQNNTKQDKTQVVSNISGLPHLEQQVMTTRWQVRHKVSHDLYQVPAHPAQVGLQQASQCRQHLPVGQDGPQRRHQLRQAVDDLAEHCGVP